MRAQSSCKGLQRTGRRELSLRLSLSTASGSLLAKELALSFVSLVSGGRQTAQTNFWLIKYAGLVVEFAADHKPVIWSVLWASPCASGLPCGPHIENASGPGGL